MPWNTNKPEICEEVLVIVDGHRNASWRNNYCLVAFLASDGKWYQERDINREPIVGVIGWKPIEYD